MSIDLQKPLSHAEMRLVRASARFSFTIQRCARGQDLAGPLQSELSFANSQCLRLHLWEFFDVSDRLNQYGSLRLTCSCQHTMVPSLALACVHYARLIDGGTRCALFRQANEKQ